MDHSMEKPLLGRNVQATKKHWIRTLLCLLALIGIITFNVLLIVHHEKTDSSIVQSEKEKNDSRIVHSEKAVVATDDGRCSEIGVSMLKQGGHAVDAAVAAALCLGVVNPSESGIGGGSFMMVRSSSSSQTQAINMRTTAPLASSQNMYENNTEAKTMGPLSIAVPGELAGLHKAWTQYGRLKWKTLFQPAIKYAKEGFKVAPYLAWTINLMAENITSDPGLSSVFKPNGKFLQEGDICFNVELGRTLEAVAEQGPQVFYNGTIGNNLVKDVQAANGILAIEDLTNYTVDMPDAVTVNAMGYTFLGMPPPSSGTVGLALVLNIFDSYGDHSNAAKGFVGLHRLIEALKHMFGIRMYLGDPNFVDISKITSDMLSPSYAKKIKQKIFDNTTFPPEYYMYRWSQLRDHGTSHLCVVDADRNAVALTTSNNYYFGSRFLSQSTGIILNNDMDDFSTPTDSDDTLLPAPNNYIEPNKRPLSSMTPIIILKDGQLAGVTGASGGLNIIPSVIQVFLNHFILGMEPWPAVHSPRVYHQLKPNVVLYENWTLNWTLTDHDHIELPCEKREFLRDRNHTLEAKNWGATNQLVVQNLQNGTLTAVGDPRKDAKPAGL